MEDFERITQIEKEIWGGGVIVWMLKGLNPSLMLSRQHSTVVLLSVQVGGGGGGGVGGGLGILSAAVLLAGEMAGSGVLALPAAMIGTGQQLYILTKRNI